MINIMNNFYSRVWIKGFAISFLVWSFMVLQFWWGNHEWNYLKDGISLQSGFFEARYTQHLPTVLFFDGQILPLFWNIVALLLLCFLGLLSAIYLRCPKDTFSFLQFIVILSCFPHTSIVFYCVHYTIPLLFWGCVAVSLLFLSEGKYTVLKFILGIVGFVILLGSYPPIFAFIFTLFLGRHMQYYIMKRQNFRDIILQAVFLLGQIAIAYLIYRMIFSYLETIGALNTMMYNIAMRSVLDIFKQIAVEMIAPISMIPEIFRTLGGICTVFYCLLIISGLGIIFYYANNRLIAFILVCSLFLASRTAFLLSASAYYAAFRVSWWGEIGLMMVFLSLILQNRGILAKNILYTCFVFFLFCFIRTDFELQKVQYLGFKTERLFQKRLEERLFSYPNFVFGKTYVALSFGYPEMKRRFCIEEKCIGFDNDTLDPTVLPADLGQVLFWDEIKTPYIVRAGIWAKSLWIVGELSKDMEFVHQIQGNTLDIRHWLYHEAQPYPNYSGIYIDDKMILFNLSPAFFNKYRELFIDQLHRF